MAEPVAIREATEDDIGALVDVYEAVAAEGRWIGGEVPVDREAQTRGRMDRLRDEGSVTFVAEVEGRVVGELGIEARRGRGEIGMAILDGYRDRGIGTALMEAAVAWARARRLDKLFLHVWPHNERAIALYEKFGFAREGYHPKQFRRRNGEAWDAISMGLIL